MRLTSLAVTGEDAGDESIVRYIYDANGRLSQKELPEGIKTTYKRKRTIENMEG